MDSIHAHADGRVFGGIERIQPNSYAKCVTRGQIEKRELRPVEVALANDRQGRTPRLCLARQVLNAQYNAHIFDVISFDVKERSPPWIDVMRNRKRERNCGIDLRQRAGVANYGWSVGRNT